MSEPVTQKNDPKNSYHAPVFVDILFGEETERAFDAFFATNPVSAKGLPIVAVRTMHFALPSKSGDIEGTVVNTTNTSLIALRPDGSITHLITSDLPKVTRHAFGTLLIALNDDVEIESNLTLESYLPWETERNSIEDAYIWIQRTADFTAVCADYLPTRMLNEPDLLGPDASIDKRRGLFQVFLPPVTTAHQRVQQRANYSKMTALAAAFFGTNSITPFYGLDFATLQASPEGPKYQSR